MKSFPPSPDPDGPGSQAAAKNGIWQPRWWQGFLWGLAEGTFFFIIPDVILSWASLAGPRCGTKILGAILAGSLLGGFLMYNWAAATPAQSRAAVASVPFVRDKMFAAVEEDYRVRGINGLLQGPGSGIPYKVYAVLAPPISPLSPFIWVSVLARLERLALSWLVFMAIGRLFRRPIRRHRRLATGLFTAFWIVVYAVYWLKVLA